MIEVNQRKIKCPVFSAREGFIQELNQAIWRGNLSSGELMDKVLSLLIEIDFLSGCPKYIREDPGCEICKAICGLRRKAANCIGGGNVNLFSGRKRKILHSYS